jgi:hypothetical protein
MGKRGKIVEKYYEDLYADYVAHGAEVIQRLREKDVVKYAELIAKLPPTHAQLEIAEVDPLEEQMAAMSQRERIHFQRQLLDEMEAELDAQERLNDMPFAQRAKLIYEAEKLEPKLGAP